MDSLLRSQIGGHYSEQGMNFINFDFLLAQ